MAIRILMRGGIYILFIVGAAVAWFLKRRPRSNAASQPIISTAAEPVTALQHPQWQVRLEAVRQMGNQTQPENLPRLLPMLNDSDSDVRDAAIEALAAFGAAAIPALSTALREGRLNSREAAAHTLGIIGEKEAIPALIDALEDKSAWVRIQAANALGKFGDVESTRALAKALEGETDSSAKQALQTALNALGTN